MDQSEPFDTVEVRITIAARPATVFAFLRDPAAFQRWMGADSSIQGAPGGQVRVAYPNGDVAGGVIEEIVPNERLVMTWGYERGPADLPPNSTRVEITLTPTAGGTRVVLRHTGLRSAAQQKNHRTGWRHYVASLSQLATEQLDRLVDRALDRYVQAWSTDHADERRRLLEHCWDPHGVFLDSMGYAEGIIELADYIGGARQFLPGVALTRDGPAIRSQGFASHRWKIVQPDGTVVMTGTNTVELTGDGLIRSLVGFWNPPAAAGL